MTSPRRRAIVLAVALLAGFPPVLDSADAPSPRHRKLQTGEAMETCILYEPRPITRTIGKNETLYFSYAIDPEPSHRPKGSLRFSVKVTAGGKSDVIFTADVAPGQFGFGGGWHNTEVSLGKFEGQTVKIEFLTAAVSAPDAPAEKVANGTMWGGVRVGDFTRKPGDYNIIFISLDTTRADRLSITGYRRPTSPNLDAFGKESVYFRKAMTQGPFTLPSHMSVFTGLYPSYHGMMAFKAVAPPRKRELSTHIPMITEAIQEHGYLTHAITGSGFLSSTFGYYRGFDQYMETGKMRPSDIAFIMNRGMGWLDRHKDKKFFLFLHTYEVHDPYLNKFFVEPKQSKIEGIRARYDGDLHHADEFFGRLRKKLEDLKLLDNTLVVIFSDHGEDLGDRGPIDHPHGDSEFDEVLRVLLSFHLPTRFKPAFVTDRIVRLIDIAPTVFDFIGIPYQKVDPFGATPKTPNGPANARYLFQGDSLLPYLRGERGPAPEETFTFTEAMEFGNERKVLRRVTPTSDVKMVFFRKENRYVLYDLAADPKERKPVDPKNYAKVFERMKQKIMAYLAGTPDPHNLMGTKTEIDPSLAETLRSLGY